MLAMVNLREEYKYAFIIILFQILWQLDFFFFQIKIREDGRPSYLLWNLSVS